jgi:bifunctional aspartokinase / homoserine dehydrogenase 1
MTSFFDEENIRSGFSNLPWQVHKFGGTSVANADCYRRVAKIVEEQLRLNVDNNPEHSENINGLVSGDMNNLNLVVVVSAMGGKPKTTDLLLDSVKFAAERNDDKVEEVLQSILMKHQICIDDLFVEEKDECSRLMKVIQQDISDIRDILKTVALMKWQAKRISELVSGYGELWSAQILTSLLSQRQSSSSLSKKKKQEFIYLDARRLITVDEDSKETHVDWKTSQEKLQSIYEAEMQTRKGDNFHFVMTGYVAVNTHGVSTTLQRDGSDYSAAIIGRLLLSNSICIWTDVDGVLSADPRRVPLAQVLPEVSYNEAMELAYFGAKVIHPKTMQPAIECDPQIPIYIRNTFNPAFRGSRIYTSSSSSLSRDHVVCGFSSIERMAMINVEGSGMIGVPGVSRRLFGTLERVGVNVVLISQASSEHSVTFATTCDMSTVAKSALEDEFRRELELGKITAIDVKEPCSIIAAVGDGMMKTAGCSGRFFSALGDAKINIVAIAQGSSERNISAVVKMEDSSRALRAVHAAFKLSHTTVRIGIVGVNEVGMSLLKLMETQRSFLKSTFDIDLQVCAVLPLKQETQDGIIVLVRDTDGRDDSITAGALEKATRLAESTNHASFVDENCAKLIEGGIDNLLEVIYKPECTNHVIFDCTSFESVGRVHANWLRANVDVVTANNTGLSGPKEQRDTISSAERMYGKESASYLREVTVGGGLPVLKTIRSLLQTGDKIRRIDGILSVSLSYIMFRISPPKDASSSSLYDKEFCNGAFAGDLLPLPTMDINTPCTLTKAIEEAIELGLMEADIMKDLNNEYTCRVLMVLARELGMDQGVEAYEIQDSSDKLFDFMMGGKVDVAGIPPNIDQRVKERVHAASTRGCVLRHVASIDVLSRKLDLKIVEVPDHHIFAISPPSCDCFRLFTKRHVNYPLIIQGPSAGVDSTASALLAELIHLMRGKTTPPSFSLSRTGSGAALRAVESDAL